MILAINQPPMNPIQDRSNQRKATYNMAVSKKMAINRINYGATSNSIFAETLTATSPRRELPSSRWGFSLLEMMIVVVLLAGILAIAWPSIARPLRKAELSEATQKLREAIEDGRYQAMMTGAPVFLQIQQGESEMRSGGIDSLIAGELSPDHSDLASDPQTSSTNSKPSTSSNMGSYSSPRATSNLASNKSLSRGLTDKDPSTVNSGVTTRTWKLPANIVVFSVAWLDEIASDSLDESFDETSSSSTAEQSTASNSFSSGIDSRTSGADGYPGGNDSFGETETGSSMSWCLPMSAEGRGRDAEITLFDTKARQTITVSFTAATGELEVIR